MFRHMFFVTYVLMICCYDTCSDFLLLMAVCTHFTELEWDNLTRKVSNCCTENKSCNYAKKNQKISCDGAGSCGVWIFYKTWALLRYNHVWPNKSSGTKNKTQLLCIFCTFFALENTIETLSFFHFTQTRKILPHLLNKNTFCTFGTLLFADLWIHMQILCIMHFLCIFAQQISCFFWLIFSSIWLKIFLKKI